MFDDPNDPQKLVDFVREHTLLFWLFGGALILNAVWGWIEAVLLFYITTHSVDGNQNLDSIFEGIGAIGIVLPIVTVILVFGYWIYWRKTNNKKYQKVNSTLGGYSLTPTQQDENVEELLQNPAKANEHYNENAWKTFLGRT